MECLHPYLESHPDAAFARYIYEGLCNGFRVGFDHHQCSLRSQGTNHPSSLIKEGVVDDRLSSEIEASRLLGPIAPHWKPLIHVSPMGLAPKPHVNNKFRLIVDLSHPRGFSVNDGIPPSLCSLRYSSVDDAVEIVKHLGRDTQLVKLDIKDAYRIIAVHPDDYHLLGISWRGEVYVDRALPFGLRSAPKIFSAVADVIAWVLHKEGIKYQLHYLDDFLFLEAPGTSQSLAIAMKMFQALDIPIATHKTEGPATTLVFLGILIDTHRFELRLPAEKLLHLQSTLQQWVERRSCTRRELGSLLGHLSHAATVVRQGRTFLRQLFPLLSLDRASHHRIRLNAGARADLRWWRAFLQDWNGTSFFPVATPSVEVISDASGSFGCGAFSISHGWFQLEWPASWQDTNIAAKELVPIVIAAALWGDKWRRSCVCFKCDNMAVVEILRSRTARDPLLMHLLRCVVFYAAVFGFQLIANHVPGVMNTAADAISRNNTDLFLTLVPQIPQVIIPKPVLDLLVTKRPNWGSQEWTSLFVSSLTRASHQPQDPSTSQPGEGILSSAGNIPCPLCPSSNTPSVSSQLYCHNQ